MRAPTAILALACSLASSAHANPPLEVGTHTFVLPADARFDPAVQQMLAQHALRALPLGRYEIMLVIPDDNGAALQEMQIRYLEELSHRRGEPEKPDR